jgi:hypothetical protein
VTGNVFFFQRQSLKLVRIGHTISSKLYEPMAKSHTQFGHPRFVIASFASPYHGSGGVKCLLNCGKQCDIGPIRYGLKRVFHVFLPMLVRRES